MELIKLNHTLPMAFSGQVQPVSDVWHRELSFRRGEHVLIEAASGTGKTSLCSYVYGYREDYEGTICFDGKDIRRFPAHFLVVFCFIDLHILFLLKSYIRCGRHAGQIKNQISEA